MTNYQKDGYFTGWQFDDGTSGKSHRIYYNDIDIATGNLLCDGKVVGNALNADRKMQEIDKKLIICGKNPPTRGHKQGHERKTFPLVFALFFDEI